MCGIAGVLSAGLDPSEREAAVARMVARQHHRGPDDDGQYTRGHATLGMCRLAVIDPAQGRQPMVSPDGRFVLVFNGAIYNYRELQPSLVAKGWAFRTQCDTEVVLAAFALEGAACLRRFRGMFAFAIWDVHEQTLFAARDALGIKPFYYAPLAQRGLTFASEVSGLLASGLLSREIDLLAVGDYLAWFSVPAPRTIYRGIWALPAGHLLRVSAAGQIQVESWWQLPAPTAAAVAPNYHEFVYGLRAQLDDSIRAHRVADVPVGAFLSGGLDSTAVVGLMARGGARRLKTFSLIFGEAGFSEQASARLAAQTFDTEHHEELITGARVAGDLPRILQSFDQPSGDGVNTWYASQTARQGGVTVALSGLGGDELFGGYPSFTDLPKLRRCLPYWRSLPATLRSLILRQLHARGSVRALKLADFLTHARDLHDLASLQRRVLPERSRLELLAPEARVAAERSGPFHPRLDAIAAELAGADDFQSISGWELRSYMADVLLRDSDVCSMAHSLELRVPLVDRPLLEWLWPQRAYFKSDPRLAKRAFADATADVVPAAIRQRHKQGFALPFSIWMRSGLRPFLDHAFAASSLAQCPWLDAVAVTRTWAAFQGGQDSRAWSRVWTLAVLIAFANRKGTA